MSTSTRRPAGRPWWEARPCNVCHNLVGRLGFWQEKPRLLAASGDARDVRYLKLKDVEPLMADHLLVCGDCYFNRYAESLATAQRQRAESRRSPRPDA